MSPGWIKESRARGTGQGSGGSHVHSVCPLSGALLQWMRGSPYCDYVWLKVKSQTVKCAYAPNSSSEYSAIWEKVWCWRRPTDVIVPLGDINAHIFPDWETRGSVTAMNSLSDLNPNCVMLLDFLLVMVYP